jgi:hypothetical protein
VLDIMKVVKEGCTGCVASRSVYAPWLVLMPTSGFHAVMVDAPTGSLDTSVDPETSPAPKHTVSQPTLV